jgi:hypothetical protein
VTPTPKTPTPEGTEEKPAAEERRAPMLEIAQLDPMPVEGIDPAEQIPAGACAFYDEDD